jgi:hypothetical protein
MQKLYQNYETLASEGRESGQSFGVSIISVLVNLLTRHGPSAIGEACLLFRILYALVVP